MGQIEQTFRKNANQGQWCVTLLPLCLFISRFNDNENVKGQDILVLTFSASIALLSLISGYRIKFDANIKTNKIEILDAKTTYFIVMTVLCLIFWFINGLNFSTLTTIVGLVSYKKCLPLLFSRFPGSFSFGEGCIALQAITLFSVSAITTLLNFTHHPTTPIDSFCLIAQVSLLSEAFLFVSPLIPGMTWTKCPTFFYASSIALFGSITLPVLTRILRMDPVSYLVIYIINSISVVILIIFWILLVVIAIVIVRQKFNTSANASTGERKLFHGLIVVVMVSGIMVDVEFTYLASLVVLGIFVYLEYIRAFDIRPISRLLDEAFARFTDEKDQGSLILTNIYLLVGIFLPLWITRDLKSANKLVLLSGVLSVGIGDSAASIIGSRYGHMKWPYSPNKSVDGTVASIIAQVIFLHFLSFINITTDPYSLTSFLPIALTSLLEAHTTQVDNLVLPLLMYILYSVLA